MQVSYSIDKKNKTNKSPANYIKTTKKAQDLKLPIFQNN